MKKKLIIIAVILVIVFAAAGGFYVFSGLERVEVQTHSYLMDKGYTNEDIKTINVNFSPFDFSLSYNGWTSTVVFADEPEIEYHFVYKDEKISGNGFTDKGALKGNLKQFN